jgi:hypothetical protein
MVAVTTAVVAVTEAPLVPAPAAVAKAAVLEIPDDDAPPPGWGQWESWPAPTLEPVVVVLVVREDGCVVPRRPTHGAEASSSHAAPRPKYQRGAPGAGAGARQRAAGLLQ